MSRVTCDLATAFPDKWAALTPGEHTIQIRAKNPGNYLDSDLSTAITFVKVVNWTINITATNCTADASNPTVVPSNTTAENPVILKFNKVTGYTLPASVVLDGIADDGYTWAVSSDGAVGTITIIAPTGNITGTITGVVETYNITVNATNATAASTNPTTITYGTTATLTFTFPADHTAPDDVTVTGATKQWTKSTGTLVLSNPTANVTVRVAGVWELKELTGTYTWKETIPEATWTEQLVNFALADGTAYKKMYWTDNGTTYNLYYDDMLEGGSETKVYSYDADAQTGTWVDPKYRIVNFTSEDVQYVPANFYNYVIANTTQATQLATPQNVTANGTVVSWDEVENATSYEVLADGIEIGTVVNGYSVTITWSVKHTGVCFYSLDNGATWIDGATDSNDPIVLKNVKQIKFKAEDDGNYYASISSQQLNVSLYSGYNDGAKYSDNIILTQNVDDVQFASGAD